jgi:hypothetical protein|tara:strand:+ start:3430 stop:3597 length:168 start_codon:yes stop_codon:yes gene_type:complete
MKEVKITLGESDIKMLEDIFENESGFQPRNVEDHLIISIMRQCIDLENIIEDKDE